MGSKKSDSHLSYEKQVGVSLSEQTSHQKENFDVNFFEMESLGTERPISEWFKVLSH